MLFNKKDVIDIKFKYFLVIIVTLRMYLNFLINPEL